ncbi:MAG: hypothetical protein IJF75_04410 [Clostridia bacterium]|nr:hypothetical protein [Clostridia bacterium]
MSKYDELRATTEKDDETVVSVHAPREISPVIKQKNPTVISILISALKSENFKRREFKENATFSTPVPKFTLITFAFLLVITILLLVMETFVDLKIVIPLTLLFYVIAVPSILIVFFIEFNTRRSIYPLHIVLMLLLGVFSYAFVTTICDKFLITFVYENYVEYIGRPIAWTLILYVFVFICCNILRVSKLPECLLVSVSFALGYALAQSFLTGFESLFVSSKIAIDGKVGAFYNVGIILNDTEGLKQSLSQLKAHLFNTFIYMPLHFTSLSVVVAAVVSYKERTKIEKKPMVKSLYLLVMLNIILYSISVVETNFILFDSILKTVAIVTSASLSMKILDYALDKESRENVS